MAFLSFSSIGLLNAQTSINVVTYNIKYDDTRDTVNNWTARKDKVVALLKYHEADLFSVQEALLHQLEDIKIGLSDFEYLGAGRDDGKKKGEYSALFYSRKIFSVLKSGTFWLSSTPEIPSKDWDAALPRVCTWAHMEFTSSGKKFFVFNTHFDHIGIRAREESAQLILKKIEKIAGKNPVILMGDFNFESTAKPYALITKSLRDSRKISKASPYGPEATFNGFEFLKSPTKRIDYVFVDSSFEVLSYATLSDSQNMKYPSDHFPVLVELRLLK